MVQHAVEPIAATFPSGQGVTQVRERALAFVLCSLIGVELTEVEGVLEVTTRHPAAD